MNDQFNAQKDILVSLKHEISLLHQQVDYLIRNEKPLGLLDLDVLMNRTHTIYDRLCSINIGNPPSDNEEVDIDPEALNALFGMGGDEEEEYEDEEEFAEEPEETPTEEPIEAPIEEPTVETSYQGVSDTEPAEAPEETPHIDFDFNLTAEDPEVVDEQPDEQPQETPAEVQDYGFIFKMEPIEEPKEELQEEPMEEPQEEPIEEPQEEPMEEPQEEPMEESEVELDREPTLFDEEKKTGFYTTGDEIEMEIPHIDFPPVNEEEPEEENPEEENPEDDNPLAVEAFYQNVSPETEPTPEEEIAYEPIIFGDMEEKEDVGFEFEAAETLGDKMQTDADHSVADMLQNQSVNNLRSSIGINDKFLFVNELFGGSMEKFNRSIGNLDDLKTLNGALIYLNELRIELQWNSNNEAYKKLLELVHRKFE